MTKVTIDVPNDSVAEVAILINSVQRETLIMALREFTKKLEGVQECTPDSGLSTIYLEAAQEMEKQLTAHESSVSMPREVELCMMDVPDWARPSNNF